MTTVQPAAVRTSATALPPGPDPTTMASLMGRAGLRPAHFVVGVAARLHVALEADGAPPGQAAVAAILGGAVHPFARMFVEQLGEAVVFPQAVVLGSRIDGREVGTESGEPVAVALLQADDGTVELASRDAERTLDARAPRQLVQR